MKSINRIKLEWKYMSYKKRNMLVGLFLAFFIGTTLIAVGLGVTFGYVRPFEKWEYYECLNRDEDFFIQGSDHIKIIYTVDNITYEKECKLHTSHVRSVYFWYNRNNPQDIIFGKNYLIVIMPVFIATGGILYLISVIIFIKVKKLKYENDCF